MRNPARNVKAVKQTVSLSINSDVWGQAKKLGLNASQIAEEALVAHVARHKAEQLQAEIRQDLEAVGSYIARHGSFAEMVREHYRNDDD